ncbi:MAG: M2 family metallopeptidase [Pseudomonadota bacterium]
MSAGIAHIRYFLGRFLQCQFHEAACRQIGWKGRLHRCSVCDSKSTGERMKKMLTMGTCRSWPGALEAFTGSQEISTGAMLRYFKPLETWPRRRDAGLQCGW